MEFKEWLMKLEQSGAINLHRKSTSVRRRAMEDAKDKRYGAFPTYMKEKMQKEKMKEKKMDKEENPTYRARTEALNKRYGGFPTFMKKN